MPPSKQLYICIVPSCKEHIRGDKLRDHYKTFVKFGLLEDASEKEDKLQLLSRKVNVYFNTKHCFIRKNKCFKYINFSHRPIINYFSNMR